MKATVGGVIMESRRSIALGVVVCIWVGVAFATVEPSASAVSLSAQQKATAARIDVVNEKLTNLRENSRAVTFRLQVSDRRLAALQVALQNAEEAYADQQVAFDQRLVEIYKNGSGFSFAVLSEADDLNDLVVRMRLLAMIADADQRTLVGLRDEKVSVAQARDRMSQIKDDQEEMLLFQRTQAEELAKDLALHKRLLKKISAKIKAYLAAREAMRARAIRASVRPNKGLSREIPSIRVTVDRYPGMQFLTAYDNPRRYKATGRKENGEASWYGGNDGFNGKPTASGEMYNDNDFTAAHKTLPFGTYLAVLYNGRGVVVRITDRGPFVQGRFLDLSKRAAYALGFDGVADVKTEIVSPTK